MAAVAMWPNVSDARDRHATKDTLDFGYNVLRNTETMSEAVSVIKGDELSDIPVSSLSQLLEGQLLGLGTIESVPDPGNVTVDKYVRGISTLSNTSPTVVVDGIIMQDYNIEYITAAEIENVFVLKDAAATAIYGLQGANGVIVINTKKNTTNEFRIDVNADFSMQMTGIRPEQISSYDYAALRNQAWRNDGALGQAPFTQEQLQRFQSGTDPMYPDNNWYKYFVKDFSTMERVGVTMSGGGKRARAWSNINIMNQTSLFNQDTEEYVSSPRRFWINFRAKVDVDISRRVSAFAYIAGNIRNDRLASNAWTNADLYETIFSLPPTMAGPLTPDGYVATMETVTDPTYGILNRSGFTKYSGMYASTAAGVSVDLGFITEGLKLTGKISFQSSNDRYNYSLQSYRRYSYDYASGKYEQLGDNLDSSLSNSVSGMFQYALSYIAMLDYNRRFGKHSVEAHMYSYYTTEQFDTVNADYPAIGLPYYNHNTGLNVGYSYNDKYVLNLTMGLTASDVFPRRNRYNFIPAVSAAWVVSNEGFLSGADWVDLLKVRASYGAFALDDFALGNIRYAYQDYIGINGSVKILGNPDLEPEMHWMTNVGIDMRLWDQFNLTFDWYNRRTDNMLIELGNSIPAYQGIYVTDYMKVNEGSMRNRGIELGVSWDREFENGWKVRAGLNWTHIRNTVLDCGEQPYPSAFGDNSGYAYSHRQEGFPAGQLFGYLIDDSNGSAYISTDEELERYTSMYSAIGVPRKGDFKYKDVNEDGLVNEKDLSPIGNGSTPTDWTTVHLGIGWKGLDLDLMFTGVNGWYGEVDYNTDLTANGIYNDLHTMSWTQERYDAGMEIKSPALSYNTTSVSALDNDYTIANRSFWRLKNASLSYTFPEKMFSRSGIRNLKIVLSGHNLFTLSALDSKVIDPEIGAMTSMSLMRVVNLGVKFDF